MKNIFGIIALILTAASGFVQASDRGHKNIRHIGFLEMEEMTDTATSNLTEALSHIRGRDEYDDPFEPCANLEIIKNLLDNVVPIVTDKDFLEESLYAVVEMMDYKALRIKANAIDLRSRIEKGEDNQLHRDKLPNLNRIIYQTTGITRITTKHIAAQQLPYMGTPQKELPFHSKK